MVLDARRTVGHTRGLESAFLVSRTQSNMVKVRGGVDGLGIVFTVEIGLDVKMQALQKAIVDKTKPMNDLVNVDPGMLKLSLAQDKNGKWLKHDAVSERLLSDSVASPE